MLLDSHGDAIGVTFAQLVGGQNLNFAIPISCVRLLNTEVPLKSLAAISSSADENAKIQESVPTGSYTGGWQSGTSSVSGAAQMTITVTEGAATAQIFLTGGEVRSASLAGTAHKTGESIWTVELHSGKPKLYVRGIIRGNSFVGDYTYTRFLLLDKGQWILKKE